MKFELDDIQIEMFEKWKAELPNLYVGLVGGAYTFQFTPTGIGNLVVVKRSDGYELDLTNYENW